MSLFGDEAGNSESLSTERSPQLIGFFANSANACRHIMVISSELHFFHVSIKLWKFIEGETGSGCAAAPSHKFSVSLEISLSDKFGESTFK